jgi:hypothetical protein
VLELVQVLIQVRLLLVLIATFMTLLLGGQLLQGGWLE